MATHVLKCWPPFFAAVAEGRKHHEIRLWDRDFAVDDILLLREWNPAAESPEIAAYLAIPEEDRDPEKDPRYTGQECLVKVTYVTPRASFGLSPETCVMSIHRLFSTGKRSGSTQRMAAVQVPIATGHIRICTCTHVATLHEGDGEGACAMCEPGVCPKFVDSSHVD